MPFRYEMQVGAHEIDTNCLATPTNTVKYMMEAVDRNMQSTKPSYQELMDKGLSFIVSRTAIEVLRPLKEYENIVVETWASESESVSFPRSYTIKVGEEVVARGLSTWALIDLNRRRPVRGSEFSVAAYGTDEPVTLSFPHRFKPLDIPFEKCGERSIMYSDVDRNFHMNNTKYFDLLFDFVPNREKIYMSSCIINYVTEAPLGKIMEIYKSEASKNERGETVYYFKTVINGKTNIQAMVGVQHI